MNESRVVAEALAELLAVLAHADRIRIVEELSHGERDVGTLQGIVGASRTSISQHLGLLRARHLVTCVRRGQHVFYRLSQHELSRWLVDGERLLAIETENTRRIARAVQRRNGSSTSR